MISYKFLVVFQKYFQRLKLKIEFNIYATPVVWYFFNGKQQVLTIYMYINLSNKLHTFFDEIWSDRCAYRWFGGHLYRCFGGHRNDIGRWWSGGCWWPGIHRWSSDCSNLRYEMIWFWWFFWHKSTKGVNDFLLCFWINWIFFFFTHRPTRKKLNCSLTFVYSLRESLLCNFQKLSNDFRSIHPTRTMYKLVIWRCSLQWCRYDKFP